MPACRTFGGLVMAIEPEILIVRLPGNLSIPSEVGPDAVASTSFFILN